jgi:hypothetical protein
MSDRWEDPTLSAEERRLLGELANRLEEARPAPAPGFRGELRRSLLAAPRRPVLARGGYRLWAASYVGAGLLCFVVAGVGLTGVGPFAA